MSTTLRVVTLNLWGTEPPLERRLALAARQLRALAPDVVCLQEVRPLDGAGRTTADVLAEALGKVAHYQVAVAWEDGAHGKLPAGEEGLAIIAGEIRDTRVRALPEPRPADARILLSAQVATAGGPIWVHTTHLHYRLDDGVAREHQVLAIDDAIRAERTNDSPPQILCGDFNATADSDEIRFLRGLTTLGGRRTHFQDAWLRLHREPEPGDGPARGITWSSENRFTRPLRSLDLDRRIDYVFVTTRKRDGRGTVHDCRVVLDERDGVGDDEICASDHYAVCADIQVVAG
ncbi:MAG TPA: endonuclease/exonuclease/phosphatase family protein [Kofleriaceae bacterium]|nr:endonuclease/exonuclease/phosphatase family protein [Kofleriaceae bacterium]